MVQQNTSAATLISGVKVIPLNSQNLLEAVNQGPLLPAIYDPITGQVQVLNAASFSQTPKSQ
jgi:hypothetical protein